MAAPPADDVTESGTVPIFARHRLNAPINRTLVDARDPIYKISYDLS